MTIEMRYTDKTEELLEKYPTFKRLAAILPSWVAAIGFPHDFTVSGRGKDNEPISKMEFYTVAKSGQRISVIFDLPKDTDTDDDIRILVMHQLVRLGERICAHDSLGEKMNEGSALAALIAAFLMADKDESFTDFFKSKNRQEEKPH